MGSTIAAYLTSDVLTDAQVIEVECADGEGQVEVAHGPVATSAADLALDAMNR